MSTTPFMPLWVNDFIGKTQDLDAKETGAYMLLLMSMWVRGGSLPNDQKKLQRIARVGREWPKVWAAISGYFQEDGGTITNERLSVELQKVNAKREVNARSGALGGRAKSLKSNEPHLANATVSLNQPEPYPERVKRDANASPKKRGSRLPDDWVLPRDWGDWALSEGWSEQVVRFEAERFRDHWWGASGQRGVKRDWLATWRNWMRRVPKFKAINGGGNGKSNRSEERLNAFVAGARGAS